MRLNFDSRESLDGIALNELNAFQTRVLNIIKPILVKIDFSILKETSFLEQSTTGLDFVLNHKKDDSLLVISISVDTLKINSRNFDYVFFNDLNEGKVLALTESALSGDYKIVVYHNKSDKQTKKEVLWYSGSLKEFNLTKKAIFSSLSKVVKVEEHHFESFFNPLLV